MADAPFGPTGWARALLRDIVVLRREITDPRKASSSFYVGLEHVEKGTGRLLGFGGTATVRSSKAVFEPGDVLYGKLRPNLNKVWCATSAGVCSTEFLVFRGLRSVNSRFLALRLLADDFVAHATAQVSGMHYPRVRFDGIGSFELMLPPLVEQLRIAERVDALCAEIDRGVGLAGEAEERTRRLPAVGAAGCPGGRAHP